MSSFIKLKQRINYLQRRFNSSFYIYILLIIYVILSLPIIIIIRLISPFYLIRIGGLWNQHIGHYAMCTELYLCKRDLEKNIFKKYLDIFYFRSNIHSNSYLTKMWKRELLILPSLPLKAIAILNNLIPGGKKHNLGLPAFDRDINSILEKTKVHLNFTTNEIFLGNQLINNLGIFDNEPFVCLFVRDDAYYNNKYEFTNYRNSNIYNYLLAAETLTNYGYYVIRMGAKVNLELKSKNKKIIDYSFSGKRSEFLDIYLASKCSFCITTGSGWDNLPNIFRRPILYTNLLPIADFLSFSNRFLNIPKKHFSKLTGKELNLKEIINLGLINARSLNEFETKDIILVENTPDEINEIVIEMHERFIGNISDSKEDEILQKEFWNILLNNDPKDKSGLPLHKNSLGRVGKRFLQKNNSWWLN